jgi:hypothetical protein
MLRAVATGGPAPAGLTLGARSLSRFANRSRILLIRRRRGHGRRVPPPGAGLAQDVHAVRIMLMIILIVFLVLAIGGGGWGHSRYGYAGWSPAGLILVGIVVLWLTGNLHT